MKDVASPAAPERFAHTIVGIERAQKYDRSPQSGVLQRALGLKPIEARHVDVEHDDVVSHLARHVERLLTVGRHSDNIEVVDEHRRHTVEDAAMIVHQQHFRLANV